jgi:glycosyltransferase involved in cell wall biosynthesis
MKVLVVTATFPPMSSGGADYAFRLCQFLIKKGVEVHVVTGKAAVTTKSVGMEIYPVMASWSWLELIRLLGIIKRLNPDVINLHFGGFLYNDHPMITFLPTIAKWIVPSAQFVTLIEAPIGVNAYLCSLPVRAFHKLLVQLTHRVSYNYGTLLRDSDSLIVLSGVHSAFLATLDASVTSKAVLIPPPPLMRVSAPDDLVLRRRGRGSLALSEDDFLIAYCGYLYPGKGVETLLEAFKLVLAKKNTMRLILIGGTPAMLLDSLHRPSYGQELKDLSKRLGIANQIIWTGAYETDSEEPSMYLRAADLCVLPFDRGVFLNNSSFASCAAHGLPIITTRGEMLEAPFVDRENVYLCPAKDPGALAEAILFLTDEPQLCRQLGKNGYALAEQVFSWPKAVEQTMAVFRGERQASLI